MREREERILAAARALAERAAAYRQTQDRVLLLREQWEKVGETLRKQQCELAEAKAELYRASAGEDDAPYTPYLEWRPEPQS